MQTHVDKHARWLSDCVLHLKVQMETAHECSSPQPGTVPLHQQTVLCVNCGQLTVQLRSFQTGQWDLTLGHITEIMCTEMERYNKDSFWESKTPIYGG